MLAALYKMKQALGVPAFLFAYSHQPLHDIFSIFRRNYVRI
ncbi:MAG: hypothetical protein K0R59_873 [Sphingobacterium sp.]|jgi:hypothetical protein|nr:hypothetical protein [Sphingobacterium sp.]